jgi:hypothetical protein
MHHGLWPAEITHKRPRRYKVGLNVCDLRAEAPQAYRLVLCRNRGRATLS